MSCVHTPTHLVKHALGVRTNVLSENECELPIYIGRVPRITGARAKVKELRLLEYPEYAMRYADVSPRGILM